MADRGTVIKASRNLAFIMNERCEFLKIKAAAGLHPGDHIEYLPRDIVRSGSTPVRVLAVAASFIIVCIIAFTAFQHMLTGKVYAYIGMEINPSIELVINSENKVVRLKGYNDDGKKLISSGDLLNQDINEAMGTLIRDCKEGNYLSGKNNNDIAVSVNFPGGADSTDLMKQIDTAAKTALKENSVNARIYYFSIDKTTLEQARKQEVSPLKYMLWEEADRLGYSIPLQSVSIRDPRILEIASDKEEKVSSGVTAGSETPPSDAVPAGENREGQETGGQVSVPKEKGRQPYS
ncbi:MAG: anti-sigma factor domain-containing protein, partial [Desulfocucumaceae bacterium]